MLSRDELLALLDLPTKTVHVPEWKTNITIRTLSAREAVEWGERAKMAPEAERGMASMLVMTVLSVIDGEGKRVFTDEDVKSLEAKSPLAIKRIFEACVKLNGGDVEALEKN